MLSYLPGWYGSCYVDHKRCSGCGSLIAAGGLSHCQIIMRADGKSSVNIGMQSRRPSAGVCRITLIYGKAKSTTPQRVMYIAHKSTSVTRGVSNDAQQRNHRSILTQSLRYLATVPTILDAQRGTIAKCSQIRCK